VNDLVRKGEFYRFSQHAREQLRDRWPDTVLKPTTFDQYCVPRSAKIIAYDSTSGSLVVEVPNTPMAAVIHDGEVVTVLTAEAARIKYAIHGYTESDFRGKNGSKQSG